MPGSYRQAAVTPARRLSQTSNFGAPPRNVSALTCAPIQSASPVPSDDYDDTELVYTPTVTTNNRYDGVLVSFPTEKAGWNDLTEKDREDLTAFVTNKAYAIDAASKNNFKVIAPGP
jgi:hypothetical protein